MNLYEFSLKRIHEDGKVVEFDFQVPANSNDEAYMLLGRNHPYRELNDYKLEVVSMKQVKGFTNIELSDRVVNDIMDRYDNTECNSDESIVRKIINAYNFVKVKLT